MNLFDFFKKSASRKRKDPRRPPQRHERTHWRADPVFSLPRAGKAGRAKASAGFLHGGAPLRRGEVEFCRRWGVAQRWIRQAAADRHAVAGSDGRPACLRALESRGEATAARLVACRWRVIAQVARSAVQSGSGDLAPCVGGLRRRVALAAPIGFGRLGALRGRESASPPPAHGLRRSPLQPPISSSLVPSSFLSSSVCYLSSSGHPSPTAAEAPPFPPSPLPISLPPFLSPSLPSCSSAHPSVPLFVLMVKLVVVTAVIWNVPR